MAAIPGYGERVERDPVRDRIGAQRRDALGKSQQRPSPGPSSSELREGRQHGTTGTEAQQREADREKCEVVELSQREHTRKHYLEDEDAGR
jgi:hypothetical protein